MLRTATNWAREATSSGNWCPALGSVRSSGRGAGGKRRPSASTACSRRSPVRRGRSGRSPHCRTARVSEREPPRRFDLPAPNRRGGSPRSSFRLARDEKTVHERRVQVALEVIPTRIRRHRERHVLYVVRPASVLVLTIEGADAFGPSKRCQSCGMADSFGVGQADARPGRCRQLLRVEEDPVTLVGGADLQLGVPGGTGRR